MTKITNLRKNMGILKTEELRKEPGMVKGMRLNKG
jgi:hypothetical protein